MEYRAQALNTLAALRRAETPKDKILCNCALSIISIASKTQYKSLLSVARLIISGV